jgi:hypothetical protein
MASRRRSAINWLQLVNNRAGPEQRPKLEELHQRFISTARQVSKKSDLAGDIH